MTIFLKHPQFGAPLALNSPQQCTLSSVIINAELMKLKQAGFYDRCSAFSVMLTIGEVCYLHTPKTRMVKKSLEHARQRMLSASH